MTAFDTLSSDEGQAMLIVMRELDTVPWARELLKRIADNGGLRASNKSYLFELRFAHALWLADVTPTYEVPGAGVSRLDFGFEFGGRKFRVELMTLSETAAAVAATRETVQPDGSRWFSRVMSSGADDPRQSEEGENLKAVERICQKFESGGRPHKFPPPGDATNVLLVDCRTLHLGVADKDDYREIAYGSLAVPAVHRHLWNGSPILGVFSPETRLRGAAEAGARVHLIGFVNERSYRPRDLARATWFARNPNLVPSDHEARQILAAWPPSQRL
jgi:hypothetical protein